MHFPRLLQAVFFTYCSRTTDKNFPIVSQLCIFVHSTNFLRYLLTYCQCQHVQKLLGPPPWLRTTTTCKWHDLEHEGGRGGHSHSLNSTPAPQRTSYFNQTMGKVQLQCNKKNNAPLSLKVTPTFHNTYHIFKHKCKSFLSVHYVMQCDNVGMLEFFEQWCFPDGSEGGALLFLKSYFL